MIAPSCPISRSVELAAHGKRVVHALGGTWFGERGMCCCPAHADRTPSLSVRVGDTALLFKCFAGCETSAVLRAIRWIDASAFQARSPKARRAHSGTWTRERIGAIWDAGRSITNTPARTYLAARGIEATSSALRYHPRTPVKLKSRLMFRPALIAAVRTSEGVVALQRTFLDVCRNALAGNLGGSRRMFGRPGRGAVMLGDPDAVLGIAEGIETALSAMQLLGIPVWATLGAERFASLDLPEHVERVILLPDNDPAGRAARDRALIAYSSGRRTIETLLPPDDASDWNDALRHMYGMNNVLSGKAT
jgi:hypothetical protein